MEISELKSYLDEKVTLYNTSSFIEQDPIQIPHQYEIFQDIEISAFLTATITWGNRKSILKSAKKMMELMGNSPYDFVQNITPKSLERYNTIPIHRTFKGEDFVFFIQRLQALYKENDSLQAFFLPLEQETNMYHALHRFREKFLTPEPHRAHKHVSSTYSNSAAKRLMMLLRWLVRCDKKGVDLGIWKNISPSKLSIPLDVHVGKVARQIGILHRQQNDWKAVEELDKVIRIFDAKDPAKYDFALFGIGLDGGL